MASNQNQKFISKKISTDKSTYDNQIVTDQIYFQSAVKSNANKVNDNSIESSMSHDMISLNAPKSAQRVAIHDQGDFMQ